MDGGGEKYSRENDHHIKPLRTGENLTLEEQELQWVQSMETVEWQEMWVKRKAGGLMSHIKGFGCYSKFIWKPLGGYVQKQGCNVIRFVPWEDHPGYIRK